MDLLKPETPVLVSGIHHSSQMHLRIFFSIQAPPAWRTQSTTMTSSEAFVETMLAHETDTVFGNSSWFEFAALCKAVVRTYFDPICPSAQPNVPAAQNKNFKQNF